MNYLHFLYFLLTQQDQVLSTYVQLVFDPLTPACHDLKSTRWILLDRQLFLQFIFVMEIYHICANSNYFNTAVWNIYEKIYIFQWLWLLSNCQEKW